MKPYPLLFQPILKPKIWGGQRLRQLGKRFEPHARIGESWEVADLLESVSDGQSVIVNGELRGQTLHEAIRSFAPQILGDAKPTAESRFPLLIKYLDANENLSVQVHPDAAYAARHPDAHLKSEAWVIIDAEKGAVIYKGLKPHVDAAGFAEHIGRGNAVDDLVSIPARVGDCHYLPSGTCHALGAGVLVAEIQTPSDTTFRVFDWNRTETGRELHIEQAMQCIHFGDAPMLPKPHSPIERHGLRTTQLAKTEHFTIERIDALEDVTFGIVTSGLPEVWMTIAGNARIITPGSDDVKLSAGVTVLIPAELQDGSAEVRRGCWLLRIKVPSRLEGLLA